MQSTSPLMDTYKLDMSLQLACVKPPPPLS